MRPLIGKGRRARSCCSHKILPHGAGEYLGANFSPLKPTPPSAFLLPGIFSRTCKQGKVKLCCLKLRRFLCLLQNIYNWGLGELSVKPVNSIFISADEGVEARETVMGPGYPFISPFFWGSSTAARFSVWAIQRLLFHILLSSLCKSRNSCLLSGTLTEFAVILKEGAFVGRAQGTECAWMCHFSL